VSGERHDADGPEIRAISEGGLDAWVRAYDASYLLPTPEGARAFCREFYAPDRSLGAFSAGRRVGAFRGLDVEVTVPGGAVSRADRMLRTAARRRGAAARGGERVGEQAGLRQDQGGPASPRPTATTR
jgi:hypothetical protein